jgi:hypothetical protein
MDLVQWILPLAGGGFASALAPDGARELSMDPPHVAAGEWLLDLQVVAEGLPLPLAVGGPPTRPSAEGPQVERVELSIALGAEDDGAPLAGESDDDIGVLSLFTEYAGALGGVLDAAELPLRVLARGEQAALELALGPLRNWTAARLGPALLLVRGAADVLARARGFRVTSARVRVDDGEWLEVDAHLTTALVHGGLR